MTLSMTGFGRAEGIFQEKKISVEIKSLNSKSFDLNLKLPFRYKELEFEIRKLLNDKIQRGKIDCYISTENLSETTDVSINEGIVTAYIDKLKSIAPNAPETEYLKMAIRMPEAINTKQSELCENEKEYLLSLISNATILFTDFRKEEGKILAQELTQYIKNIENQLSLVQPFEEERITAIKERYENVLKEFNSIDETRFYQEMAYFTEKLDISEEKVRLKQHLKYFLDVLNTEDCNGKKLGFISQEIGREVNTLGSKANHHEIQKIVVAMKDDLEKIKEQSLNVL